MPSKSMSPMPIQSKIGDASLKFGPDWLRALSSSDSGTGVGGSAGGGPGGWSTGSGGGGGGMRDGSYSSAASSNQHHHHSNYNPPPHREVRLSSGSSSGTSNTPYVNRFQPPEFGYGREEMLALFDKNLPPPAFLPAFGTLFIEKMQPPLAFSQPSEDELRVWHVPQPESSRQASSGPAPVGRGGFTIRGRGVGIERGGRGRGRGSGGYYPRPHEEDDRGSFSRPRTFERSQSAHERVWAERNGGVGPVPSPPEDGGARGGSWRTRESYGSKRYENEDDGWRKPRWRRGEEDEDTPPRSSSRRLHKSWSDDGAHDNLPEWAKDNPSEESGTFDASGAFHEEDRYSAKSNAFEQNRRDLERNNKESKGESEPYGSQNDRVQKRTPERNDTKDVIPSSIMEEEPDDILSEGDRLESVRQQQLRYRSSDSKSDGSNTKVKSTSLRSEESSVPLPKQTHQPSPVDMSNDNLTPHQTPPLSDDVGNRQSASHTQSRIQQPTIETRIPNTSRNINSLQEEHYYSMTEEADMVAKLIEDDGSLGGHSSSSISLSSSIPSGGSLNMVSGPATNHANKVPIGNSNAEISPGRPSLPGVSQQAPGRPPSPTSFEIWFYRDPQGSVQGPFATHEMAQWYSQGYFTGGLLLRRECDKIFITLAEMGKLHGRNPFLVIPDSPPPPPLVDSSPNSALDNIQDPSIQAQYLQRQLLQQNILREQQQQYLMKLSQSGGIRKEGEAWQGHAPPHPQFIQPSNPGGSGLTPAQIQTQMLLNMAKQVGVIVSEDNPNPIEHLQAIFSRQAQGKVNDSLTNNKNAFINPMMQQQMNAQMDLRKSPTQASPDPIQSLVQQLTNMVNPQQQKVQINKQMDQVSHWGNTNVPTPSVQQQQMGGWPNQPQENNQMWEYRQQFMKLQQQQKLEGDMLRQKEEEQERKRMLEEEERKRQEEQQRFEAEEHEKNRKLMEEQYLKKKQEEMIKQQQAADLARQKEHLLQQQRLHQQELERQQQRFEQQRAEQQRLEQQRAEQQRLEQQRQEQQRMEQLRQEQQEREEQQRRIQLEHEEQQRRLQQEHEEKQRQHQLRLQEEQEAVKQQEMQKFSWMTAHLQQVQPVEAPPPALSLLEIQQEEAMKEEENAVRQQAAKKSKQIQQEQARLQREAKAGLSLKWAQTAQPQKVAVKSFAEIQAEEQAKLAKQQEKDREQRAIVNQHTQLQQAWSSSLTWANRASLNAPPTTPKLNGGIWDDPPPSVAASGGKQGKSATTSSNSSPLNTSAGSGNVGTSNKQTAAQQSQAKRAKESDETFMKLFQEHGMSMKNSTRTQSQQDEFTRWCSETVEGIGGGNIDIATFVSFLKEVESPYEVNDYIRSYLGDGRDAREFGKEFLERRSRWKNARNQDGGGFEDNLCRPAYAVNPTSSEFQEVKVKGKKSKKGKMQKVDSRILGFNTTSAPDRVNVGKRDYGDGTD